MTIFRYSEEHRKKIWNELTSCEFILKNLKSIVQNEFEVSSDDWYEWAKTKKSLCHKLDDIQQYLKTHVEYIRSE